MKLNSINTYNQSMKAKSNPNFGMAKWASQKAMVKFFNAATNADYTLEKAYRYIETIKNNTQSFFLIAYNVHFSSKNKQTNCYNEPIYLLQNSHKG